ncbi:hypothetical protein GGI09_001709 [Coemansia sp. S100]|nr:hypothetical protein GGI09_001709 [Coemansia sp. S100]
MGPSSVTPRIQPFAFSPRGQIPCSTRPLRLSKSTAHGALTPQVNIGVVQPAPFTSKPPQQSRVQPQHTARSGASGRRSASPEHANGRMQAHKAMKPAARHIATPELPNNTLYQAVAPRHLMTKPSSNVIYPLASKTKVANGDQLPTSVEIHDSSDDNISSDIEFPADIMQPPEVHSAPRDDSAAHSTLVNNEVDEDIAFDSELSPAHAIDIIVGK